MICRICGSGPERGTRWIESRMQNLCILCELDAPPRLSRSEFDIAFWGTVHRGVPEDLKRNSYNEYLSSNLDLKTFIVHSMEVI